MSCHVHVNLNIVAFCIFAYTHTQTHDIPRCQTISFPKIVSMRMRFSFYLFDYYSVGALMMKPTLTSTQVHSIGERIGKIIQARDRCKSENEQEIDRKNASKNEGFTKVAVRYNLYQIRCLLTQMLAIIIQFLLQQIQSIYST